MRYLALRLAGVVALAALAPRAAEAVLLYEPFDYDPGVALDGLEATGQNLTGTYETTSPQDLEIASPGLTYGNVTGVLPGVTGNRLSDASVAGEGNSTVSVDQDVPIAPGQPLYFAALFTLDESSSGTARASIALLDETTGDEIVFGELVGGIRSIRIGANTQALGGFVADGIDGAFEDGQTLWLIARYQNSADAGGDTLELVGYDTADPEPVAPFFDLADPNAELAFGLTGVDIDFELVTGIRFDVRGTNDNFIDELRIGRSYGSVVTPEPSSAALLALGLGWLAARRRRS